MQTTKEWYLKVFERRILLKKYIPLTSSEIACLWNLYMDDSAANCILKFMLKDLNDPEIKPVIHFANDLTTQNLTQLKDLFKQENFSIPNGFTDSDVNYNAPWLYSDTFCLNYVGHLAKIGMVTYSGFVAMSTREDVCDFFTTGLQNVTALFNKYIDISLLKGLNPRHPFIEVPKEADYINSKKYLSGLNPFIKNRPLNAVEISYLYVNILTNVIGEKITLSFAQTSSNKEVQDFMLRAKNISQTHIKNFMSTLLKDEIQAPHSPDVSVSDSTTRTFSDKLMMFQMSLLTAAGIGNYATAAAASQRSDLTMNYELLSLETAKLAKSGADIMIKNNWLEQPPQAPDREKLIQNRNN